MAKSPAVLFYTSDFLSGVSDLTMEERGQYITLLCAQHQKGDLTEKTIRLLVGSASKDVLEKFVILENGSYRNIRMHEEIEKRENFTESRKNNGHLGGRPKASGKPSGYPYAKPSEKHMPNLPDNENEDENKDGIEIGKKQKPSKPDWKSHPWFADQDFSREWDAWGRERKAKGTERNFSVLRGLAGDDLALAREIVTKSADNGWKGLFAIDKASGRGQASGKSREKQKGREYDEDLTL